MTQYLTRDHDSSRCQLWATEPRYTEDARQCRFFHHRIPGTPCDLSMSVGAVLLKYRFRPRPGSKYELIDGQWVFVGGEIGNAVSELRRDARASQ